MAGRHGDSWRLTSTQQSGGKDQSGGWGWIKKDLNAG